MAAALPRHIQLKLEQTLAQWRQWQCLPPLKDTPVVVALLDAGIGNYSVLVESGQRFVIRIDGLNPTANGLSRQAEWRTLGDAHRAGLAPNPRYFNPELGSLVCDYLQHDEEQDGDIADVGLLLRAIHQLPARRHRLDLAERIRRYEKQLEHRQDTADKRVMHYRDRVMKVLHVTSRLPEKPVLCHNDLLRANRLYSAGRLWALDWEYCAMGSPYYDLAVVIHGDALSRTEADALVESYLGGPPDTAARDSLFRYGCIYRYLELLWYLALDKPLPMNCDIEEKLTALDDLLV